jgi:hypothetical protein
MLAGVWRSQRPSNEAEAQAVLESCVAAVRERGYEDLRRLAGTVRASCLGGRFQIVDGDRYEFSEETSPSGARYEIVTAVGWHEDDGGRLSIEVKIQESAEPGGWLLTSFVLGPDGSFELEF